MRIVLSDELFEDLIELVGKNVKVYEYTFEEMKNNCGLVLVAENETYFFTITSKMLEDNYSVATIVLKKFEAKVLESEQNIELKTIGKLDNIQFFTQKHFFNPEGATKVEIVIECAVLVELSGGQKYMLIPEDDAHQGSKIITETDDVLDSIRRVQLSFHRQVL